MLLDFGNFQYVGQLLLTFWSQIVDKLFHDWNVYHITLCDGISANNCGAIQIYACNNSIFASDRRIEQ
jgi:hypothetical protein